MEGSESTYEVNRSTSQKVANKHLKSLNVLIHELSESKLKSRRSLKTMIVELTRNTSYIQLPDEYPDSSEKIGISLTNGQNCCNDYDSCTIHTHTTIGTTLVASHQDSSFYGNQGPPMYARLRTNRGIISPKPAINAKDIH